MENGILKLVTASLEKWGRHLARVFSSAPDAVELSWIEGKLHFGNGKPFVPVAAEKSTRPVSIAMPFEMMAAHEMDLPSGARDHVDGIVRNKLPQISPWPVANLFYGYRISERKGDPSQSGPGDLGVEVFMVDKATAYGDPVQSNALNALPPGSVSVRTQNDAAVSSGIMTLKQFASGSAAPLEKGVAFYKTALAACLFVLASAFLAQSAVEYWRDTNMLDLELRQSEARRQLQTIGQREAAPTEPSEIVRSYKNGFPPRLAILDLLARTLPDSTYLTELQMTGEELKFTVVTTDTAMLLRTLSDTGVFEEVAFSAPSVRDPQTGLQSTELTARVSASPAAYDQLLELTANTIGGGQQ